MRLTILCCTLATLVVSVLADDNGGSSFSTFWSFFTSPEPEDTSSEGLEDTIEYMKALYDNITDETVRTVTAALKLGSPNRRTKRDTEILDLKIKDSIGVYRLTSVDPLFALCPDPLDVSVIDIANRTHAACISAETPYRKLPTVTVGTLEHSWKPKKSWEANDPKQVATFADKGVLYVLVADSDREDGVDLIKYSPVTEEMEVDHTISSRYPTAIAVWDMVMDGSYHLAIANSPGSDVVSLHDETHLYQWMGTYFDKYSVISTYDVKDIQPFHIHSLAFLAVANHRITVNDYHVDSEIFKYDIDKQKWKSYQRIRTYGAMDWEFFSLGQGIGEEFFLAVANYFEYADEHSNYEINSVIYKFVEDKFVPFQCLPTSGATSITAIRGPDDFFLLAIANLMDGVALYQYNGWHFVLASVQYTRGTMGMGAAVLTHHFWTKQATNSIPVLVVANRDIPGDSVFELGYEHENKYLEWYDASKDWCWDTLAAVKDSNSTKLLEDMENSFFIDQEDPIEIKGNLHFRDNVEVTGTLKTPRFVELSTGTTLDHDVIFKLDSLQKRISKVTEQLSYMLEKLKKAFRTSGDQVITGHYTFNEATFICSETELCEFDSVTTDYLNGENIEDLEEKVIFTDRDQVISSPLDFEKLVLIEDLYVKGLVNGMRTSDFVTASGDHVITGRKSVLDTMYTSDITVSGMVDSIKLDEDSVLLDNKDQIIGGNLRFSDIEVDSIEIDGYVNGVNIDTFYNEIVLVDGSYTITGTKTFGDLVINGDLAMKVGSNLDGVDIIDLQQNAVWTMDPQEIKAPATFSSVTVLKDLNVGRTVNGILIPDSLVLLDKDNYIDGKTTFLETTTIADLRILGTLNGLGLITNETGASQLDILMKSGGQTVTGRKTFRTIHLGEDSIVEGTINGVYLSDYLTKEDSTSHLSGTWIFKSVIMKGPLKVQGFVNNINVTDLYDKVLKIHEPVPEETFFFFNAPIHVQNLLTSDLNGLDVTSDLVLKSVPQEIWGVKTFEHATLKANSHVRGLVNGVDLAFLNDSLLAIGDQIINSHKTINGDLTVPSITVKGLLNGIDLNDVVNVWNDEVITSTKKFEELEVANLLKAEDIVVDGLINDMNLGEMVADTMTYTDFQKVTGRKTIMGNVTVAGGCDLKTDSINGIDLRSLKDDTVLLNFPQTVGGTKVFLEDVNFTELWVHGSIDGVTMQDMDNWLLQNGHQVVTGEIYVMDDVLFQQDVKISGSVNGIDIVQLDREIVKINEPAYVEGPVIFKAPVISRDGVSVMGTIQGIDVSEEAVLISGDNVITGRKTFQNVDAEVASLKGLLNGMSLSDICTKFVTVDEDQVIEGKTTITGSVQFLSDVTVDGLVGGIDLEKLYWSTNKAEEEAAISGYKSFETLVLKGPVTLNGLLGGLNVKELNKNYLSLSKDQEITGSFTFLDEVDIKGSLAVSNLTILDGMINGVDIVRLNNTVLKTTGFQIITAPYSFNKVFFNDITVQGRIDGLKIPDDVMQVNGVNYINSSKIFANNLVVLGDLKVEDGYRIQDVDVSAWEQEAVFKGGEFSISGVKNFASVIVDDIRCFGLVDGVDVSKEFLLTTHGVQRVTGDVTVHGNVVVSGDVSVGGLVNGVELSDLVTRTVRRDGENRITGIKKFEAPLYVEDLTVEGLIDNVDIEVLAGKMSSEPNFGDLNERLEEQEKVIWEMQETLSNQAVLLKYYEKVQEFKIPGAYACSQVILPDGSDRLLLSSKSTIHNGCSVILVFKYNAASRSYTTTGQTLKSKTPMAIVTAKVWGQTFLFVANFENPSECMNSSDPIGSNQIFAWNDTAGNFELYQKVANPASDVAVFSRNGAACVVLAETPVAYKTGYTATKVYCSNGLSRGFFHMETLETTAGRTVSVAHCYNQTVLAVGSTFYNKYEETVDIYTWDAQHSMFGKPTQQILATNVKQVKLVNLEVGHDSVCFLFVVESRVKTIGYAPPLTVYRNEPSGKPKFVRYQTIAESGVENLEWTTLPSGDSLLFISTDDGQGYAKIYRLKGASGFVKEDYIKTQGATKITAFIRPDPDDHDNHYLVLTGFENDSSLAVWNDNKYAVLLRSKIKGKRLPLI